MNAFSLIKQTAENGLKSLSSEEVVQIACAYWHENYTPDLEEVKKLEPEQQAIVGYMTEFFSTFNCVSKKRTIDLIETAREIKSWINSVVNPENPDEIAGEWGLVENLNEYHKDFLFYQTRHYQHEIK